MRTVLVTGSDTGVGKTRVAGALARLLAAGGRSVQVVKVVETGVRPGVPGDAARACAPGAAAFTLFSFAAPLAPAAASAMAGQPLEWEAIIAAISGLPKSDWRIYEGAGGIASPLDDQGRDWADFAREAGIEHVVLVVADRIGAINQARLTHAHAAGLNAGIWLNAVAPAEPGVSASIRAALRSAGIPIWAEQAYQAELPDAWPSWVERVVPNALQAIEPIGSALGTTRSTSEPRCTLPTPATGFVAVQRWRDGLDERERRSLRRRLRLTQSADPPALNLADNDYLSLARDPAVIAGAAEAARRWGTSASASPLVTGWREPHEKLLEALLSWHGFPFGLLWTSGYAANGAVLSTLPVAGDLVLADRLIHHSMIAGLMRSGARLQRYPHLDLDRLEAALTAAREAPGGGQARAIFVATESVFSMDGDYPDLRRMAALKQRFGFFWILDEAHGLGWYGPCGAGLAAEAGVAQQVDVLVGTLGKTLASGGAYALFREEAARDHVLNQAGEFIYSTALPPPNAGAAQAALQRIRELAAEQPKWRQFSAAFRRALQADGWTVPDGDSPIVPVHLGDEAAALELSGTMRGEGIWTAAVRPPTVPAGTSRLRLSLKRTFSQDDAARVRAAMTRWRKQR